MSVGIYAPRKREEIDYVRHAAQAYQVDFTFQVGGWRLEGGAAGVPHHYYRDIEAAEAELTGAGVRIVPLELDTHAVPLRLAYHPDRVAYLVGPNTGSIPRDVLDRLGRAVKVESPGHRALNTASVVSIVLHDRYVTGLMQEELAASLPHNRKESA